MGIILDKINKKLCSVQRSCTECFTLYKRKKFIDMEETKIEDCCNYYTLYEIKAQKVSFNSLSDIKVIDEKVIPEFCQVYLVITLGAPFDGFCILKVYDSSCANWHALVDVNFIKKCCIKEYSNVLLNQELYFNVAYPTNLNVGQTTTLCNIKIKLISMLTMFEDEAVNAFKFGLIDVFINMIHQLEQSSSEKENDELVVEVDRYIDDVYKTMCDMGALKEFSFEDSSSSFNEANKNKIIEQKAKLMEENIKKEKRDNFINQIHARQELIRDFNKSLSI